MPNIKKVSRGKERATKRRINIDSPEIRRKLQYIEEQPNKGHNEYEYRELLNEYYTITGNEHALRKSNSTTEIPLLQQQSETTIDGEGSSKMFGRENNFNDTRTESRNAIVSGCQLDSEEGSKTIPPKCENVTESEKETDTTSGENIIEISSDEEWVEEIEEKETIACCDDITRTNRCAELKLDNSELLCFNKELKRGFDIFHVIHTGKPTTSIWYNQKETKCDALDLCSKTHTICKYFDGKESEHSGQLHTNVILASYVLDKSERSPEGEQLRIRRAYFRERQYLCRGCADITRKRYGHYCHICNLRISVKHVTTASYYKNAVVYVLERD
nr:uncharacterized protein LOC124817012 isoform X1 [Hydra vulgaris]